MVVVVVVVVVVVAGVLLLLAPCESIIGCTGPAACGLRPAACGALLTA